VRKSDIGDPSRDLIVNNADRVNMETNVYGREPLVERRKQHG
jgi:hypothetical protein